jgi:glutamate-5-semialdehyde dehydrogenase
MAMTVLNPEAGSKTDAVVRRLAEEAKAAAAVLALASTEVKNAALTAAAAAIRRREPQILSANHQDLAAAEAKGATAAFRDRLALDKARTEAMARGLEEIAAQPDPIGTVLARWSRPNGLDISRIRVPLGVIGIIFESRPNVTADAGGLCLKSGNAAILRGGSESLNSAKAIHAALREGLATANLPEAAIQLIPTTDRAAVGALLRLDDLIDVIVPRGGRALIERVAAESRIPVLKHLDGICHTYVDGAADLAMARRVTLNAKMRRTGICGATETLLVDRRVLKSHLPALLADLITAGCEVRGDAETQALDLRVKPATPQDWDTEYLDSIIAVRVVDGVEGAIRHIAQHGSRHTEAIITDDPSTAERFLAAVDAGIVMVNASTQFADGGEFGMGAEIGISTGKLHARGPVGAEQLTSIKYVVRGTGQIRP